ncbi:hypothetical protein DL96DRAFT_1814133 [Flagelloscypha sp. PMI_526]|nr:hypothetical protein DL96DRAFT_1814133 [Flagelloscypha sp. PMI_526]
MPSANRRPRRAPGMGIELPFELWEMILRDIPKAQLWMMRSLNRSIYFIAARTTHNSISLTPRSIMSGSAHDVLERICAPTLPIARNVHTLHLHSDFEAYDDPKGPAKHQKSGKTILFDRDILLNPNIKICHLTIHCAQWWVRPYVRLAWKTFADTLVHLELQFFSPSILQAVPEKVYCANLKTLVLIFGRCGWERTIRSPHVLDLESELPYPELDDSLIQAFFALLKVIVPPDLESLGLHSFSSSLGFWNLDPSYLRPDNFPRLKRLQVSTSSIAQDSVMLPFLLPHALRLESLSLTTTTYQDQIPLRNLPIGGNLQELFLTYKVYCDIFALDRRQSKHASPIIQRCTSLRRLIIGEGMHTLEAFHLVVELARGGSMVEELELNIPVVKLPIFRAALLLLSHVLNLIFSGIRQPASLDILSYSTRPKFWREQCSYSSPSTYQLIGLGKSASRLNRDVRQAMTKALREDIDTFYKTRWWTKEEQHELFSALKKALNGAKGQEKSDLCVDIAARNHPWATMQVVEGCLVGLDTKMYPSRWTNLSSELFL